MPNSGIVDGQENSSAEEKPAALKRIAEVLRSADGMDIRLEQTQR